jgi:S-adenosylmethionine synthetase
VHTKVVVLFTEALINDRLTKSINRGGHFIYGIPTSENGFTVQKKTIYGARRLKMTTSINLFSEVGTL